MKMTHVLTLFIALGFCTNSEAKSEDNGPKIADVVFVVDMEFHERPCLTNDDDELIDRFSWLVGKFSVVDGQCNSDVANDEPGALEKLDVSLRAKGVVPRYGLVIFDRQGVAYQSLQPGGGGSPSDLWSHRIAEVEERLLDAFCEPNVDANSDGRFGQDAIMRVLGLQVIPGEDPANDNFGVEPAYEFNPGCPSIFFISSDDTDVSLFGTFPVELDNQIVNVPDHQRRHLYHNRIKAEMEASCISFHSITPSLFAADAGDKEMATDFESENRSKWFINFPDETTWETDADYIQPDTAELPVTKPLLFKLGRRSPGLPFRNLDRDSYEAELDDNCLLESTNAQIQLQGWSLCSRIRSIATDDKEGRGAFLIGDINDFPSTENELSTAAAVEIAFQKEFTPAGEVLIPESVELFSNYRNQVGLFRFELPAEFLDEYEAEETITIEIRTQGLFIGRPQLNVFLNGLEVPATWPFTNRLIDVDLLGIHSRRGFEVAGDADSEFFDTAAFDYINFYVRGGETDIVLGPNGETTYDFQYTALPFREFVCNDFGTDGGEYGFAVHGISWRDINDGIPSDEAWGYWRSGGSGFTETGSGKHVFSEGFQDLHYIRLGEATRGSAWSLLPIVLPIDSENSVSTNSGYTENIVESISTSVCATALPCGAAVVGRHVFYNGSSYDLNDEGLGPEDADAIAPNKSALFLGETSEYANYTNYSKGINGIIVDIETESTISESDFRFRVGNDDFPDQWEDAPAPIAFEVFAGAGANGSDRVKVIWEEGQIDNQWLEVTVFGDELGLIEDDRFYFGSNVGETGQGNMAVTFFDLLTLRQQYLNAIFNNDIEADGDFNRDGFVNVFDVLIFRPRYNELDHLEQITPREGTRRIGTRIRR